MPKVSVLVPIYNVEDYLEQCLDSLVTQTLRDIEIICINDGSTDGSLEIIKRYAASDPRIVIIDKANSGYGDSMNRGLRAATGEYIGIVESDDWAEPTMFEDLYKLGVDNRADVVKSNYINYFTSAAKKALSGTVEYVVDGNLNSTLVNPAEKPWVFYQRPSIWTSIYRRAYLNDNQIEFLPSAGASYQDTGFQFKTYAMTKRVFFSGKAYLHYRQDNEQSSINSPGKTLCVGEEYEEIKRYLKANGRFSKFADVYQVARWGGYYWNIQRLTAPLAKEFIDFAHKQFKAEEAAGDMDLSRCEPNQYRGIKEILNNPEMSKARKQAQSDAKVSVVVAVYNVEDYLPEAIESLKQQSIKELDIILVDDGSTDNSIEMVEQFYEEDPRVRLFSQYNRGLSAARNVGITEAAADYITFMDSDDTYPERALEWLLEGITTTEADIAIGSAYPLFETGTRNAMERRQDLNYFKLKFSGTFKLDPVLLDKTDVSIWNKIFRTQRIIDTNLRFPEGLRYEDAYFTNAYCWLADTATYLDVDKYVYNYRRRRGSIMDLTFSQGQNAYDHIEIVFRLLDVIKRFRLQKEYGKYYLQMLNYYVDMTLSLTPHPGHARIWTAFAKWLSFHYETIEAISPEMARKLQNKIPKQYRAEFVGQAVQNLPARIMRKGRRTLKKALWSTSLAYRAAAATQRRIDSLDARVNGLAGMVTRGDTEQRQQFVRLTSLIKGGEKKRDDD